MKYANFIITSCYAMIASCALNEISESNPSPEATDNPKVAQSGGDASIQSMIIRVNQAIHDLEDKEREMSRIAQPEKALTSESRIARARFSKSLIKCRKEFEELRQEIETGRSVHSYPGLINLGKLTHIEENDTEQQRLGWGTLEILVGYTDLQFEGIEPRYYQITFDKSGIIREHEFLPMELE